MTQTRTRPPAPPGRIASHRRTPRRPMGPWIGAGVTLAVAAVGVVVLLNSGSHPRTDAAGDVVTAGPGATTPAGARPSVPPSSGAPRTSASPPAASGNPLAGVEFYGPNRSAADQAQAWSAARPDDAAIMRKVAATPVAEWFGDWNTDPTRDVRTVVDAARGAGRVAVLVAYNLPDRDCGGHSGGGAGSDAAYKAWIDRFAAGIGDDRAVVILEPDALAQLCGDAAARYGDLTYAVNRLARTGAVTYLDSGHADWLSAGEMAARLKKAGIAKARGFALNVSNFVTTAQSGTYAEALVKKLPGDHGYVIDTSRNGKGAGGEWCNPPGRALGPRPTTATKYRHADAYLWVKVVGESDGECNGGPAAGQWMPEYALALAKAAGW